MHCLDVYIISFSWCYMKIAWRLILTKSTCKSVCFVIGYAIPKLICTCPNLISHVSLPAFILLLYCFLFYMTHNTCLLLCVNDKLILPCLASVDVLLMYLPFLKIPCWYLYTSRFSIVLCSIVLLLHDFYLFFSTDVIPENIALATDKIKPYNVMPVYGKLKAVKCRYSRKNSLY